MKNKKNILVLCTGNSCRSQIAHGYLEKMASKKANIYSAGVETHGLNYRAIATMMEDKVYIAHHTSNLIEEYLHIPMDHIITVCDNANERCPIFPGKAQRTHHNFQDPSKMKGDEMQIRQNFRNSRNEIKDWCKRWIIENL
jgi:arsenate reductase (thioredoxin)